MGIMNPIVSFLEKISLYSKNQMTDELLVRLAKEHGLTESDIELLKADHELVSKALALNDNVCSVLFTPDEDESEVPDQESEEKISKVI